jgi:hypothetical protein
MNNDIDSKEVFQMLILKDIGIRKFACPKKKFNELLKGGWDQRFSRSFHLRGEMAIAIFGSFHEKFLGETHSRTTMEGVPEAHVRKHIEFGFRSRMGWKNDFDLEDDIIDMLEKFKNQTRPSSFHGRANMLYALDLVLSFLDHRPESNEEKFEFFKRIAEAGILSDPLILLRVLNNHGNRGISHLADDLISRTELCTAIPGFALISPAFANESELAQNFKSGPMPSFDLGGKYATYAVDGQIGPRVWMFPDEIEAGTVMSLASIIAFGVYPGGVVGSNINYHEIFLGIDRADIDLLTIYPESQALILVPMDLLGQSEYPYKRTKNTHSWYDDIKQYEKRSY